MNEKQFDKYSKIYLSLFIETTSLKKLESELKAGNNPRLNAPAAAYIYFNEKSDKLNQFDHPLLKKEVDMFKNNMNSKELKNTYAKVFNNIYVLANKKNELSSTKGIIRRRVNEFLKENHISVPSLSRKLKDIDRSNLNKFLKGNDNVLSLDKLQQLRRVIK